MDRKIIVIQHEYAHLEEAAARACYRAAALSGLTRDQADQCDECSLKCADCPFKEEANERI